jgi:hypothetical protein
MIASGESEVYTKSITGFFLPDQKMKKQVRQMN